MEPSRASFHEPAGIIGQNKGKEKGKVGVAWNGISIKDRNILPWKILSNIQFKLESRPKESGR